MKAECKNYDCDWHGYDDQLDDNGCCPCCGGEVELTLDDFSPFGEDW